MPNYDYRCLNCKRRFDIFIRYADYGTQPVSCPHCGSDQVQRRINKVRIARSDESRLEDMASPESLAGLEDDPRALGRMMRQMSGQMGEDMGPEFDEVVSRLEAGQSPDEIDSQLPDMGGADDSVGGDFGLDD